MKYQEICIEQTHSRSKCKREFKGVLNKVLVSGLALAMVMGSSTTAFAANSNIKNSVDNLMNDNYTQITSEYGVSVESAISQIRNTINSINQMKANGSVSDSYIKNLASQIYALETAATSDSSKMSDVTSVLNEAESAVKGLSNASEAETAIKIVRGMLGLTNVSVQNKSASITDFTDMTGHWAYDYVARMVQDGLFAGTSATTFSPNAKMSEVQFLTVVLRKAFPTELEQYNAQYTSTWYDGAYRLGLAKGIINSSVYGSGADMNRDITRERMTDMAIKGLKAMGENTQSNIAGVTNSVNDLNKCGDTFKMSMIEAYTMGIIAGKDTDKATGKMNVDPKGTATRAEGATVLYRFAYPDARTAPDFSEPVTPPSEDINGPITIYEGQTRTGRPAKAGDTFVKADGTKVTITLNKDGVIDPALGIAPDLGLTYTENGVTRTVKDQERVTWVESWGQCLSGADYRGQMYQVNPLTGAGMFEYEWAVYENNNWPNYKGTTQYEVSVDKCFMWVSGDWYSIVNTPELAQLVK